MSKSIDIENQNQIKVSITEKICISEMVMMIHRFIQGLESLNMSSNELIIALDVLKKINGELRIELIDRLIRFNEFANKLNIKLIEGPKNCILNTAEYISNGKYLKIKPIDLSLKDKYIAYCHELPFGIISPSSYVNIETMNIICSDVEIN